MNWIHWTEKEPKDREWILVCYNPYPEDFDFPPTIGWHQYKKYDDSWNDRIKDPESIESREASGWTYWVPFDEVVLPDFKRFKGKK